MRFNGAALSGQKISLASHATVAIINRGATRCLQHSLTGPKTEAFWEKIRGQDSKLDIES